MNKRNMHKYAYKITRVIPICPHNDKIPKNIEPQRNLLVFIQVMKIPIIGPLPDNINLKLCFSWEKTLH